MKPPVKDEMPEIDVDRCKVIRRSDARERKLTLSLLRRSLDMSQEQVAERAGITQSEVSRAEKRVDCLVSTLARYAKALDGELLLYVKIGDRKYPIAL